MAKKAKREANRREAEEAAAYVQRLRDAVRVRHFPYLGWATVLVAVDMIEFRGAARMYIGTWYGFEPDEVIELRARRMAMEGEPERTWWVLAIPESAIERKSRVTAGEKLARIVAKDRKSKKQKR